MGGYIILAVTLVTTALGVYIGASFTLAQKQILAATRLLAYLMHWKRWATDSDVYWLFAGGEEWDKEEQELIRRGASEEELSALKERHKANCGIAAGGPNGNHDEVIKQITHSIRSGYSKENIIPMLDSIKVGRQNIITGQQFITDEEASYLGLQVAYNAISLKNGIVELSDGVVFLLVSAVNNCEDIRPFTGSINKLLWKAATISKDYHGLLRDCRRFTNSSVLGLTWRNIIQGSRINRK